MHREPFLHLLNEYSTSFADEQVMLQRMKTFVTTHTDCFERSLSIGHITASAWVLNQDRNQVLLTLHSKLNKWLQPGGHCDGNPDVLATAKKELEEETGTQSEHWEKRIFDVDIHLIPKNKKDAAHLHFDVRFLAIVSPNQALQITHESKDLSWIPLKDLHCYNNSWSMMRMREKSGIF